MTIHRTEVHPTRYTLKDETVTGFNLSKLVAALPETAFLPVHGVSWGARKSMLRAMADRYPNCYASIGTLAKQAGLSTRQAKTAIMVLRDRELYIERLNGGEESGFAAQYALNVRKIENPPKYEIFKSDFDHALDLRLSHILKSAKPANSDELNELVQPWISTWCNYHPWGLPCFSDDCQYHHGERPGTTTEFVEGLDNYRCPYGEEGHPSATVEEFLADADWARAHSGRGVQ